MTNDERIVQAIEESLNTNPITIEGDIKTILKASMKIISSKSKLLNEINNFGVFKPYVPKTGPIRKLFFENSNLHTSITLNSDLTNIAKIEIATTNTNLRGIEVDKLNFEDVALINYRLNKSKVLNEGTDNYLYIINRLYHSIEYPNVIVSILVELEDEDEFNKYTINSKLPENIKRINLINQNESQQLPFQTIGEI